MEHKRLGTDHLLVLSEEETDEFFDAFNANDLPSHLYYAGHRYIKDEPYNWMIAHVGEPQVDWSHISAGIGQRAFQFKDGGKAALFKLTFYKGV